MTAQSREQTRFTGALGNENRLKLGTFSTNLEYGGAITTLPGTLRANWEQVKRVAQMADRMGLEAIVPVARWRGYGGKTNFSGPSFDTFCWAAGLAMATENAHIFSTVHVPTIHPIVAAKQLTTVDHISGGRSVLNVVGGWFRPELEMFGRNYFLEHDRRYDLAEEWTKVLINLWTCTDEFDFEGEFFHIKGGYSEPKPFQKPRPPIMNAGGSDRGRRFAAEFADMLYIHVKDDSDIMSAKAQVDAIKNLAREFNRTVQVWTQCYCVCRDTEKEARDYWNYYVHELGDYEAADNLMHYIGLESAVLGKDWERARDRFISGWGGVELVGTPEQIFERLRLIAEAGCDGTLLMFPIWEEGLIQFRDKVLPLLERAGLRTPYVPPSKSWPR